MDVVQFFSPNVDTSLSVYMSYFEQKLNTPLTSAFDLLSRLYDLTGLVYLYDQNTPTIAFLPQELLVSQKSTLLHFQQIHFNQYQIKSEPSSLLEFCKFNQSSNSNNIKGFTGGYIGFLAMTIVPINLLKLTLIHRRIFS